MRGPGDRPFIIFYYNFYQPERRRRGITRTLLFLSAPKIYMGGMSHKLSIISISNNILSVLFIAFQ